MIFSVFASADGVYPVQISFASGKESQFSVHSNGHALETVILHDTQNKWELKEHQIFLRQGHNTLSFRMETGEEIVRIDHVKVRNVQEMADRGATLPYFEMEAEDASSNGVVIGPNRTYRSLPSEAQGRKAVQISTTGQYVEFTLLSSSNAMVVRYSIPDSADGTGQTATLGLYVNGAATSSFTVTSKYSWIYGAYPYTNVPSQGLPHHFYDDVRVMFSETYPSGTKIKLAPVANGITFTIDVVSFYTVPAAYTMPSSGFLSVTSFGADSSGVAESTNAFLNCFSNATKQGLAVWIPKGKFLIRKPFQTNNITIRGAGNWYSVLFTDVQAGISFNGIIGGHPSVNVELYDFAIIGATTYRNDSSHDWGVGNQFSNSIFQNLWIEHTKVGFWMGSNVQYTGVLISGCTVRNTMADGINLYRGATNALVEQCMVRNTGDDCLAIFPSSVGNTNCTFRFNTVGLPMQANGIGVYGGTDSSVTDNVVYDVVVEGGAFQVGNRYDTIPLNGTTIFARNTAIRGGANDRNGGMRYGGIVVWPENSAIYTPVLFDTITLTDSMYSAILFATTHISNVFFRDIDVDTVGTAVIEVLPGVNGSTYVTGLRATNLQPSVLGVSRKSCSPPFLIQLGPNNVGWNDSSCPAFPTATTSIPPPAAGSTATLTTTTTASPSPSASSSSSSSSSPPSSSSPSPSSSPSSSPSPTSPPTPSPSSSSSPTSPPSNSSPSPASHVSLPITLVLVVLSIYLF
eukprot:Phypoly_transcript_01625.p1 GENE.Phypoly_transcript_01625~~Phypoly_transcript_01625.p1  ORF type:complete len:743 (+),score=112.87 Phypoly_transcript_01625:199-2427(+)